ncbi:3-deoxy-D-manno-octulosonic acid transferase [Chitinophaga sp. Cy-1792]|uniref:3-deoxy-D-manno-octulosonic acid transferase n=1 Tax=Chitinophaga sp. Cy-1792 TaxID=2608339 RepID=UPI0019638BE5|nr:glycosyltransferase N-terminal domain-containing protein [Chitinophaga sp. Cy-1792]
MGKIKAKRWLNGRKHWAEQLAAQQLQQSPLVWVHAASLGEFEQGRPVLEAIRHQYPDHKILLTFFSPSGYEVRKNYPGADYICYLPLDTRQNAAKFLDLTNPQLVIFIKYEFWLHFLSEIHQRNIPNLLISGIFREKQVFFKGYGGQFRKALQQFTHLFVQNKSSLDLLHQIGIQQASVSGDTRFDRVSALLQENNQLPLVEKFIAGKQVMMAGSTWPEDEKMLAAWWKQQGQPLKLIIAPHEIHEQHIQSVMTLFPDAVRYSSLKGQWQEADVLIVDNIGMLTTLYRYATLAYVGGGLAKGGIHNILEPAVYSKPVAIGPVYEKYFEAVEMVEAGGATVISNEQELLQFTEHLLTNQEAYEKQATIAGGYVAANTGATGKILAYIQEKRFLRTV